ncbi:hypothetical protein HEP87_49800 [Streptomyces sp. S1D4-11]|nr:hypothetical protein [Streptomyces sp. S1D4-11]QIZ00431.1 hypothetical protein HEP87_49800 [Streptomyces sp. S1D4-11]
MAELETRSRYHSECPAARTGDPTSPAVTNRTEGRPPIAHPPDTTTANFEQIAAAYSKSLDQMRHTLQTPPEHERTAVEEAARELGKARSAAAYISLDRLNIRSSG